ncbi:MAG: type III-B CRISPR module RAMP protein Cmr4 [Myxococcota bacterium]
MDAALYVLHALSPIHVGTGRGEGLVDLPIARERVTGHPVIPGSSVKGVLRDAVEPALRVPVFGPSTANASDHAGALRITDAQLLLMPVTSDTGTFAWVTSRWQLARLVRDAGGLGGLPATVPDDCERPGEVLVADGSALLANGGVVLADLSLPLGGLVPNAWREALGRLVFPADPWWRTALDRRLAIVDDDVFTEFARQRTEVRPHVRIDDATGTAQDGGLWYTEALPAEAVLTGLIHAVAPPKQLDLTAARVVDVVRALSGQVLRFGGHATTGAGRTRFQVTP